jgi:hypothetical protein
MSSRLCYAWLGDEGGGGCKKQQPRPEKERSTYGVFHDGQKWIFKRDGKVVAESKPTFVEGSVKGT